MKLPYVESDNMVGTIKIVSTIVGYYFQYLANGMEPITARKRSLKRVRYETKKEFGSQTPMVFSEIHSHVMITFMSMHQVFNPVRDFALGGDIKMSATIEKAEVYTRAEGVFIYKDLLGISNYLKEYHVLIIDDWTPRKQGSHIDSIRNALIRKTILRTVSGTPMTIKVHRYSVKTHTFSTTDVTSDSYDKSRWFASALIRHIRSYMYLPTTSATECETCHFKKICNTSFCKKIIFASDVAKARDML